MPVGGGDTACAVAPRTRAVCVVHLYSSMADMDAYRALAARGGCVALVEDCAQAHGAAWRDARAGSLGTVGYSACSRPRCSPPAREARWSPTSPGDLARRLEQVHADGRVFWRPPFPHTGELELAEVGEVMGSNQALSEVQAALLLEGLTQLEVENRVRERNAQRLDAALGELPGVTPVGCLPGQTRRSYYHYVLRIDVGRFGWTDVGRAREPMLSAELRLPRRAGVPPAQRPSALPAQDEAHHGAVRTGIAPPSDPARFHLPDASGPMPRSSRFTTGCSSATTATWTT